MLVVTQAVSAGASADELIASGAIASAKRRQVDLPGDAVSLTADIRGQVTAIALQPNEVVTRSKFVPQGAGGLSNAASLDKGNVAVAVSTDRVRGVSNLITPGDFVNLMVTLDPKESKASAQGVKTPVVMLYQKTKVLAIDNNLGTRVTTPTDSTTPKELASADAGTIVLEVPADASTLIASAEKSGGLYLALVRPDYEPTKIPSVVTIPKLPGQDGKTPYPATTADPATEGAANQDGGG